MQGERGERREGKIPYSPDSFILHCIKLYSPSSNARGGALPFLYKSEHSSRLLAVPTFLINPLSRCWKLFPGSVLDLTVLAVKVFEGDAGVGAGVDQTEEADPICRSKGDSLVTDRPPHNLPPCVSTSFTSTSTMTKINCNKSYSILFS